MNEREALKLALDFIVESNRSSQFWLVPASNLNKTVTAIREALAQPELTLDGLTPTEFALRELYEFQEATGCDTAAEFKAQPEQEPVAWLHTKIDGVAVPHRPADLDKHPDRWEALYKTPPQPEPVIDKSAALRIATSLGWEPKRKPLDGVIDVQPIGYHSLQLIFRSQTDIAKFKAAHGIKE